MGSGEEFRHRALSSEDRPFADSAQGASEAARLQAAPKFSAVSYAGASASIVVTIVQEARSERVLEALRDLTRPRAMVIKDNGQTRILGYEVGPHVERERKPGAFQ